MSGPWRPLALALLAFCALDCLALPVSRLSHQPMLWPATLALGLAHAPFVFAGVVAPNLAASLLASFASLRSRRRRASLVGFASTSAIACHAWLIDEPALVTHPLMLAASVAWGALNTLVMFACDPHIELRRWARVARPRILAGLIFAAGVGLHIVNLEVKVGLYPGFHALLAAWTCGSWLLAVRCMARARRADRKRFPYGPWGWGAAGVVVCSLIATDGLQFARPAFLAQTQIGNMRVLVLPPDSRRQHELDTTHREGARALRRRFAEHHGLPELGPSFDLDDTNVLLIVIEAMRFDQTTLGDSKLNTTPNLAAFAKRPGSYVHTRAYSPSTGTLHSMGALMSMATPSTAPIETWKKNWHGALSLRAETVAELFALGGHYTFWVGHNFKSAFTHKLLGLGQGFDFRNVISTAPGERYKKTDAKIVDGAIEAITAHRANGHPFFGWVMLVSPHADYRKHYPDWPGDRAIDRYHQELHFADDQLGRLLDHLRVKGFLKDTLVIVTGDHGEEFREHGGTHHKATVYSEVAHVPLVLHIPGHAGGRLDTPTSLSYLFPWLFHEAPGARGRAAAHRIEGLFGPLLRASANAVPIELIGQRRMQLSLVWPEVKLNYDFLADRVELFDLVRDPGEQTDIFGLDAEASRRYSDRLDAYLHERSRLRQYWIAADKRRATPEDLRANAAVSTLPR